MAAASEFTPMITLLSQMKSERDQLKAMPDGDTRDALLVVWRNALHPESATFDHSWYNPRHRVKIDDKLAAYAAERLNIMADALMTEKWAEPLQKSVRQFVNRRLAAFMSTL